MKIITITLMNRELHLSQPITGLISFAKKNHYHIVLRYKFQSEIRAAACMVLIDGKQLCFDMDDGYNNINDYKQLISECDFYFKRSFSSQFNAKYFSEDETQKIFPYGLNYYVTCPSNPFNFAIYSFPYNIKRFLKYIVCNNTVFTEKFFRQDVERNSENGCIIFFTRLYEPNLNIKAFDDDRIEINNQRIKLVRALRAFPNFVGGIEDSEYSRKIAPDCIIEKSFTKKENYINTLRKASICITSVGLHGSTGWKFAEYLAMNKIIVSDELKYEIPGDFSGFGKNYFSYSSVEECVEICKQINNSNRVMKETLKVMRENNAEYYDRYLKPIKIIENCFEIAGVR